RGVPCASRTHCRRGDHPLLASGCLGTYQQDRLSRVTMTGTPDIESLPRPRLHRPGLLRGLLSTVMFIIAVYVLAEMAIPRSNLEGPSMQPNLHAGQYLIISRLDYLFGDPQRGDVAVFQAPDKDASEPRLIKRVIGLPGETVTVSGDEVFIDGQKLDEPYFILRPCTRNCQEQ